MRSPRATAVVTSAMLRTWLVRLLAMKFTLSVRSFQVPATSAHVGLAAQLALGAHLAGHAGHLGGERAELIHHRVDGVLELEDLALHLHRDLLREVAARRPPWSTSAMLRTWSVRLLAMKFTLSVRSFQVPATPFTSAWPPSRPSVPTSRATRVTSEANELAVAPSY